MAELFAEREKKAPALLPSIRREEQIHSAIDSLGRSASNMRTHSEGTYGRVEDAVMATRIAANVQSFLQEGSAPLSARFTRLLSSI
jgi:hypothetical protein